ncbi:MAG: sugar ABC transporter permease [Caldilineaceae bacterium]
MTTSTQLSKNRYRPPSRLRKELRRSLPWYPFILVNILVFVVFNLVPWLSMFSISLFKTDLLSTREFVGLEHFVTMVSDEKLHKAMLNTFAFTLMYIPLLVVISFVVAVLVNRPLLGMKTFRSLYFLPNITSVAVLALIFRRFLSPRPDGPLNFLIGLVELRRNAG